MSGNNLRSVSAEGALCVTVVVYDILSQVLASRVDRENGGWEEKGRRGRGTRLGPVIGVDS